MFLYYFAIIFSLIVVKSNAVYFSANLTHLNTLLENTNAFLAGFIEGL
ncbi:hypothetical protein SpAn4DRAFT_3610 [Sporomusa ovata]|uniref:Uncharacterized protein n=1 Tax=Sporomusa ovata TaxID=2378 RepID=A0A0U1KYK5_9FIRM|nr:hypothetical protein SpAn4DRAFT_3610 [Sporomusa ovata]